jgi:2-iminobutanoate/2-iminopropanoate deaminase
MVKPIGNRVVGASGVLLPISAAVEVGDLIFLSGQMALIDGKIVGSDITAQANTIFDQIEVVLRDAGLALRNVCKVTGWLTRREDFHHYNSVFAARFAAPFPTRSTVVSELVVAGALVEVEVIASRTTLAPP